jgi:DNA-binding MurR/RpiR family transcriptional regulator
LIAERSDRLTPVERRLAEVVAADPVAVLFGTAADLAARAVVSRPSVVRFARKLGFDGYASLQAHVRANLAIDLDRPTKRIRDNESNASIVDIEDALAVVATESAEKLTGAASRLARARAVWIVSGESSAAGAAALTSGLAMLRPAVTLLDERTFARQLASVGPGDVAIAIAFHRYRRWAVAATKSLAQRGAAVIAITDGPLSPLAPDATERFDLVVPAIGPFDSSIPPVALSELLVAATASALGRRALAHIDRIEEMWSTTSTFTAD